ncbi:MAG TPA: Gfo/Idh/MocA family oxidoreductase, partial [Actinophytocola sp.]|nr:Gfo/Idh/MocA family oxidoreductase [Actinophytocola sp.]
LKAVAVLFRYPDDAPTAEPPVLTVPVSTNGSTYGSANGKANGTAPVQGKWQRRVGPVRVGFVGAGNYASSMLLPHLVEREDVALRHVVTTSALSGANARRKFGFADASTELDDVLADDDIDAVFVVTRHSSHAELTARALRAGKAVFVEKPLALSEVELAKVLDAIAESGNDRLQVGFNRRFAPLLRQAKAEFGTRVGPASVRYLVNAGKLDHGSWYNQAASEGSRFAGEGGHFVDTVSWLLDGDPVSVFATATPGQDDLQILLRYPDGSTAALTYATSGAPGFPKETLELLADRKVLRLDDFLRASVHANKRWATPRIPRGRDKGQRAEIDAFLGAVAGGGPMPVPVDSLVATTLATLAVQTSLNTGAPVRLELPATAHDKNGSSR